MAIDGFDVGGEGAEDAESAGMGIDEASADMAMGGEAELVGSVFGQRAEVIANGACNLRKCCLFNEIVETDELQKSCCQPGVRWPR